MVKPLTLATDAIYYGNELIARFCGGRLRKYKKNGESIELWCDCIVEPVNGSYRNDLWFHTQWNYIMEVCSIWDNLDNQITFNKENRAEYGNLCDKLDDQVTKYKKYLIFLQLIENIEWYNKIMKYENK